MSYVLREVDVEARETIRRDASDRQRFVLSNVSFFESNPGLKWALDEEAGNYLVLAPRVTREDADDDLYYFGFRGRLIELRISAFHDEIRFGPVTSSGIEEMDHVKREIAAAFLAYGRNGIGPEGDASTTFAPVFAGR